MSHKDVLNALMPVELDGVYDGDATIEGAHLDAVMARAEQLLAECFPDTTDEMILFWERVCSLTPDSTAILQQRRDSVVKKIRSKGGLSIPYFIALAAEMGMIIAIEELGADDGTYGADGIWVWLVTVFVADFGEVYYFRVGESTCGEHLSWWTGEPSLEGLFNSLKPAHTLCNYTYSDYMFWCTFNGTLVEDLLSRDPSAAIGTVLRDDGWDGGGVDVEPATTNLLSACNPGLASGDTTSWSAIGNTTLAIETVGVYEGDYSLDVEWDGDEVSDAGVVLPDILISPADVVSFAAELKTDTLTQADGFKIVIFWLSSGDTLIREDSLLITLSTEWARYAYQGLVAPSGTVEARCAVRANGTPSPGHIWIDAAQLEKCCCSTSYTATSRAAGLLIYPYQMTPVGHLSLRVKLLVDITDIPPSPRHYIMHLHGPGTAVLGLFQRTGAIYFEYGNATGVTFEYLVVSDWIAGQYHLIVCQWDFLTGRWYLHVDSESDGNDFLDVPWTSAASEVHIGCSPDYETNGPFVIDDVKISANYDIPD